MRDARNESRNNWKSSSSINSTSTQMNSPTYVWSTSKSSNTLPYGSDSSPVSTERILWRPANPYAMKKCPLAISFIEDIVPAIIRFYYIVTIVHTWKTLHVTGFRDLQSILIFVFNSNVISGFDGIILGAPKSLAAIFVLIVSASHAVN